MDKKEEWQPQIRRLKLEVLSVCCSRDDKSELLSLLGEEQIMKAVEDYEFVLKYERLSDTIKKRVLKLSLKEGAKALKLARQIESFGRFHRFRLYNVDLLPAQYYFYDKDLFPLAFCYFDSKHPSNLEVKDNVCSTDYWIPDFKSVHLTINLKKEGKIAKPGDMISSIVIQLPNERIEIQKESEVSTIQELMEDLNTKIDPDFVFTDDGDSFTFPHLIHRADVNGIPLIMSREPIALKKPDSKGSSLYLIWKSILQAYYYKIARSHTYRPKRFFFLR